MGNISQITRPAPAIAMKLLRCLLLLAVAGHVAAVHASLGGDSASVETDRLQLRAAPARQTASASAGYSMDEFTIPSGTRVRQYVSSAGVVFAVSWSGPFMPNLRQLLGPHFDALAARQSSEGHAGQRFIGVRQTDLVIESGGHPRSYVGRAYLPGALPAGVTEQQLR
jgi:hypothetical protein